MQSLRADGRIPSLQPQHIAWKDFIDNADANARIRSADLVVAHAGMGTILTRLETGLPMIVMPRRAAPGRTPQRSPDRDRKRLSHLPGLWVGGDEEELCARMSAFEPPIDTPSINSVASPSLIAAIQEFVSP
jgi:UDP-N-acetylglucosamine transferase subunit ALG13